MPSVKNAAYFETQLRPRLANISDRSLRATVEDLLAYTAAEEEKQELEAKVGKQRPRPDGDDLKRLVARLKGTGLQSIEASAGAAVRQLIEELIRYAESLTRR